MTVNAQLAIASRDNLSKAYPPGIHWDVDLPQIDLPHLIDESFHKYSKNYATNFYGKRMTYKELGDLVQRTTKGLQQMGVKKGTKVGLCLPNCPYYPIFFLAALRLGATVVNFSPEYIKDKNNPKEFNEYVAGMNKLAAQIEDSGTTVMVTLDIPRFQNVIGRLKERKILNDIVTCPIADMMPVYMKYGYKLLHSADIAPRSKDPHNIYFPRLIDNDGVYHSTTVDHKSPAVLQYTGGTTGVPKAAMLTHANLTANVAQIEEFYGAHPDKPEMPGLLRQGDGRVAAFIPYFHVFGMMTAMILPLRLGQEMIMVPNPRNLKDVLNAIKRGHPTMLPAIPRLLQVIADSPEAKKVDLSGIETIMSGGAPLPGNLKSSFEAACGQQDAVKQGYGLSETSPAATSNPAYGHNDCSSVGLPYPGTEVRIASPEDPEKILPMRDENGEPVPGEIQIRGPQVMSGYFNRPDETAKVMTKDGFFRTGDIGYLDDHLYLHITDRLKRMVTINGMKVFPTEIEMKVGLHPDICECVALSVPNESTGEATKLIVRLKTGASMDEAALREFLSNKLLPIQMPKFIEFTTNEILKTGVGKPDWNTLQKMEKAKYEAARKKPAGPQPI